MSGREEHDGAVEAWRRAARDARVRARLESVYERAAAEIRRREPECRASGRCCNFRAWGHRLYVTGLEAAYTLAGRGVIEPARRSRGSLESISLPILDVRAAEEWGDCPFLVEKMCGVHEVKPLGCRVYYCDPTAREWQSELSEAGLAEIRSLHEEFEIPYRYAEWRYMLSLFAAGS